MTRSLRLSALHNRFGVEVHDVPLARVTAEDGFLAIRDAFEHHSLLLFRDQDFGDTAHIKLAQLFGPIEDRSRGSNGPDPRVSPVSNCAHDGGLVSEQDLHLMHLKANQLWHTDSTFLPSPALANILAARVVASSGGETEFVSTRAAWADMPDSLRARTGNALFKHRYAHSRAKISEKLANDMMFTQWQDQTWRAIWPNPVTGEEALYIASHVLAVEGLSAAAGELLVTELMAFTTQVKYVYRHQWMQGDVLIWDERATMHRGCPWPYDEERSLDSICVTARDVDGLDRVRP